MPVFRREIETRMSPPLLDYMAIDCRKFAEAVLTVRAGRHYGLGVFCGFGVRVALKLLLRTRIAKRFFTHQFGGLAGFPWLFGGYG